MDLIKIENRAQDEVGGGFWVAYDKVWKSNPIPNSGLVVDVVVVIASISRVIVFFRHAPHLNLLQLQAILFTTLFSHPLPPILPFHQSLSSLTEIEFEILLNQLTNPRNYPNFHSM